MLKDYHCVILHGTGGSPEGNWFPWLKAELEKLVTKVSVPTLPSPEEQSLESWTKAFEDQIGELKPEHILIGHSMGAGLILRLLERSEVEVFGTFLVSGWEGLLDSEEFDPLIESFYQEPINYEAVKEKMGVCKLYHGSDDPYVPLNLGVMLAGSLDSSIDIIQNGGHLNAESNFLEFPKLLSDVRSLLSLG